MTLNFWLTLILLELKVINFCHHYSARPACTSMQSDLALLLADQLQVLILISLKVTKDSSITGSWVIPFRKCSRLRVLHSSCLCYSQHNSYYPTEKSQSVVWTVLSVSNSNTFIFISVKHSKL